MLVDTQKLVAPERFRTFLVEIPIFKAYSKRKKSTNDNFKMGSFKNILNVILLRTQ